MAAFRRYVIALAVLALFAGLASAQTATMTCNLSSLNTTVRAESRTDLVSDLLITCTGGTLNTTTTVAAPTVNLTLTMPQAITSRILTSATGASEALLLIDDPGTSATGLVPGYGNNASPILCPIQTSGAITGCSAFPNLIGGFAVMQNTAGPSLGVSAAGATSAANVYQGVVSGSSVTFFGVPVVPPGSSAARTFRITNVRVNASAGTTGSLVGSIQVVGGAAPLFSLNQTQATLATVQSGLTVKSTGASLSNCSALNYAFAGTVAFTENFASAFRTRVLAGANGGSNATNAGQSNTILQNVPGTYFTESGYEITIGSATAGLADFGTRLKAVFNNIPSGMRVFVSFSNVTGANVSGNVAGAPSIIANSALVGTSNTTLLAELITGGESVGDSTAAPLATPSVSSTTAGPGSTGTTSGGVGAGTLYSELSVSGGSATAVWEILNTNTASNETATFNVWVIAPAQQATGQSTVNASYAPLASGTIPSFVDPNAASPQNAFVITQCKTILLFPYVTAANGFDTGIAIANTSTDVYGTTAQTGSCAFNIYGHLAGGGTLPTNPVAAIQFNANTGSGTTANVASGDVGSFAISQYESGFTGYMIAVCNFQYAHGFAFVADWTSTIQSSAMGYLALILPGTTTRGLVGGVNAESLTQ